MEQKTFEGILENLKKQLDSSRQNWLFGAGISCESNIPLMYPLTERIKKIIEDSENIKSKEIYSLLTQELDQNAHIEHYLSHLGDLIAIADRSKQKNATFQNKTYSKTELLELYGAVIFGISTTIRYGYTNKGIETIGEPGNSIVKIEHHIKFVRAIFSNRSNLLSRSKITFFTINYDTLLEDALALERFTVIDGFSGGAIGYWNPQIEFQDTKTIPNKCLLYKLHGSIDWQQDERKNIIRTRYGTGYLPNQSDIMIYPQATKYVETQKDPFSYLFNGFRIALNSTDDNILITCGYSFGDDHVNAEIEAALSLRNNSTTLIAFIKENPEGEIVVNKILDNWLENDQFKDRIYVAGQKGLYHQSKMLFKPNDSQDLNWWTFSGLTNFLSTGEHE